MAAHTTIDLTLPGLATTVLDCRYPRHREFFHAIDVEPTVGEWIPAPVYRSPPSEYTERRKLTKTINAAGVSCKYIIWENK